MSWDVDDYYNEELQDRIKETELLQLPIACEHPFDCLEITNVSFNSSMDVIGISFICKKCNLPLRRWVKAGCGNNQ